MNTGSQETLEARQNAIEDLRRLADDGVTANSLQGCWAIVKLILTELGAPAVALDRSEPEIAGWQRNLLMEVLSRVLHEQRAAAFQRRHTLLDKDRRPTEDCFGIAAAGELFNLRDESGDKLFRELVSYLENEHIIRSWEILVKIRDNKAPKRHRQLRAAIWYAKESPKTAHRHTNNWIQALMAAIQSDVAVHQEDLKAKYGRHWNQVAELTSPLGGEGDASTREAKQLGSIDNLSTKQMDTATNDLQDQAVSRRAETVKPELIETLEELASYLDSQLPGERHSELGTDDILEVRYSSAGTERLVRARVDRGTGEYLDPPLREGTIDDLGREFDSTSCLTILGGEGAGKSVAARELALQVLHNRESPTDPIPVIFQLYSWNPRRTNLRDFVANHLATLIASIQVSDAKRHREKVIALELIRKRLVLPIFDGLDEIATGELRKDAVKCISMSLGINFHRLALTSRFKEYEEAVDPRKSEEIIQDSTVVQLLLLELPVIRAFLRSTGTREEVGIAKSIWDPLFDRLKVSSDPRSQMVLDVLAMPLMVSLARDVYKDVNDDPSELLDDVERFPDHQAIRDHLLDRFIDVQYSDPYELDRERHQNSIERSRRQLGLIAACLTIQDTEEVSWWRLSANMTLNSALRTLSSILAIFGTIFGVGMFVSLAIHFQYLPIVMFLAMLCYLGYAYVGSEQISPKFIPRRGWTDRIGKYFRRVFSAEGPEFQLAIRVWIGLGSILIIATIASVIAREWFFAIAVPSVGIAVVAALALPMSISESDEYIDVVSTPTDVLRSDIQIAVLRALLVGGIPSFVFASIEFSISTATIGSAMFIVVLVGIFLTTSTGAWLLFHLSYCLDGSLPWSIMKFLRKSHSKRILRQSGFVYQFRHSLLQAHLARDFAESNPRGRSARSVSRKAYHILNPSPPVPLADQLADAQSARRRARRRFDVGLAAISIIRIRIEMGSIEQATRSAKALVRYLPSKTRDFTKLLKVLVPAHELLGEMLELQDELAEAFGTYSQLLAICERYKHKVLRGSVFLHVHGPQLDAKIEELEDRISEITRQMSLVPKSR